MITETKTPNEKTIKEFSGRSINKAKLISAAMRGEIVYPIWYTGSGRWIKSANYLFDVKLFAETHGINFTVGNNAPRGGQAGTFIVYHL